MLIQFLYDFVITQSKVRKSILNIKKNVQMEKLTFIFSSGSCIFPENKISIATNPIKFQNRSEKPI